jgi:predicted DNA-binding transcriptional regulator AlpA
MKNERPPQEGGGAEDGPRHHHLTSPPPENQDPEAADCPPEAVAHVPIRDKLRWTWDDLEALTGISKRWMQREISAGRMPSPDLRMGRRAGWRPSTIATYLDELADRQRRSSR